MNAPASSIEIPTIIGTSTEIGIYFGRIRVGALIYALFQPPKALARHAPALWNSTHKCIEEAYSFCDGQANTEAMAKAGSELAQWALDHKLHIPSLDESDLQYRAFKPGIAENNCWMRSGINLSAETPLQSYTPDFPKQTTLEAFLDGGPEAFAKKYHWTSTQLCTISALAWAQHFGYGHLDHLFKYDELPVRAIRRLIIL